MHVGSYSLGSLPLSVALWLQTDGRQAGKAMPEYYSRAHEQRQFYVCCLYFVVVLVNAFSVAARCRCFFVVVVVVVSLFLFGCLQRGATFNEYEYWLNGAPMLCIQRLALN